MEFRIASYASAFTPFNFILRIYEHIGKVATVASRLPGPFRIIGFALLKSFVIFLVVTLSAVLCLRWVTPPTSSFILQSKVAVFFAGERGAKVYHQWVAWPDISPNMPIAVVAAEDQRFPEHWGFDFESISDAIREHQAKGRLRGASTISQQVAKNLFLWPRRSWLRKGLEAYFTVLIELSWPKRRILEVYLNIIQFGDHTFGIGAASRRFFRKSPSKLTGHEAALLAAVLPSPGRMQPHRPSAYVLQRARWVQRQMKALGGSRYLRDF
jgi:monofunctional biosynthetic peptidoglycan transglycosylase